MTRRRRLAMILATGVFVVVGASCSALAPAGQPAVGDLPSPVATSVPRPGKGGKPVNWDNPIGGKSVASSAEAATMLAFEPLVPKNLGNPRRILVNSAVEDVSARAVAFVYDSPRTGTVIVTEEQIALPPSDYDRDVAGRVAAFARDPTAQGSAELMSIRGGKQAVMARNPDGSLLWVVWREGTREVMLRGSNLSPADAVNIAEGL